MKGIATSTHLYSWRKVCTAQYVIKKYIAPQKGLRRRKAFFIVAHCCDAGGPHRTTSQSLHLQLRAFTNDTYLENMKACSFFEEFPRNLITFDFFKHKFFMHLLITTWILRSYEEVVGDLS